ncbi:MULTISPECIES: cysteine synthase A [unclassified Campylobacter]|uniref:cysteine synthase A n=1 Tax=unclassified Campylobacter TaxID=2593542 RepID=UPI0012383A9F|nr:MULTISPECIES: cysteine synthase A [unclassified Campylobacter]KAA6228445.1 cysteine synthase A [Campylobacter sp. LR185c]KAA6228932.1 cysteine synthase A [Campylobacter sp. LR196d]KAA6229417.1 cysteine synthase A [Campylobacter sp. LR286c]KAA6229883.1 cysteine synthase A [Campylobacter sp. LR264d]KAA6234096.1 cysteine synthase A [Campylobacter sp. LR291e]
MKIYSKVSELIGNTPIIRLEKFGANIFAKCEFLNPSHSVKDRPAYSMIKTALDEGKINKDSLIIEATSGNMGIALSMICADLGLKIIITMPESMSIERRKIMQLFGATLELTPASLGMKGAVEKANELLAQNKNAFIPSQFANLANKNAHRRTTAQEILNDLDGQVDIFVAGVGTGGTISGVGEILKEKNADIKIIAVEPQSSPLLSQGTAGGHKIQGIGANFVPDILNRNVIDEILTVSNEDAINTAKELAKSGLMVGISSGANVYAATLLAKKYPGKNIVTMLNDTAERYLSTDLFAF